MAIVKAGEQEQPEHGHGRQHSRPRRCSQKPIRPVCQPSGSTVPRDEAGPPDEQEGRSRGWYRAQLRHGVSENATRSGPSSTTRS